MLVKKLHPDAIIPSRANPTDAGLDLHAIGPVGILPGSRMVVKTGIAVAIPEGYVGLIWPRSGLAVKKGVNTLAGVIDSGYRGELMVAIHNTDREVSVIIEKGDRVAQLLIQPVMLVSPVEVEDLDSTERGENGFGSSGN